MNTEPNNFPDASEEGENSDKKNASELDLFEQLQAAAEEEDLEDSDEGITLEELSQTYAQVLNESTAEVATIERQELSATLEESVTESQDSENSPVSPKSIIESILFVGRPNNEGISPAEIAKLMRGVSESDVMVLVGQLNQTYAETERAVSIVETPAGLKMDLVNEIEFIRERFYGRVREVTLTQAAIDCLALVAYQPGLTRAKLEEQRGQPSGGVLNQLVRRRLLEIHREGDGSAKVPHYYPTERLAELAGLSSLEDLPQVEELEAE